MGKAKAIFSILLLLSSLLSYGQVVSFRKGTIFTGTKPYAYLEKSGSAWAREFTLKNLEKEELVQIKPVAKLLAEDFDFIYYELNFKGLPLKAEMQDDDDFVRILAYEIGKFKILKNDSLDPVAVEAFVQKYPAGKFSKGFSQKNQPLEKPNLKARKKNSSSAIKTREKAPADSVTPADNSGTGLNNEAAKKPENSSASVQPLLPGSPQEAIPQRIKTKNRLTVENNLIKKGRKVIGKVAFSEKKSGGQVKKTITFLDNKSRKIATATISEAGNTCELYIFKDRKTRTVPFSGNEESLPVIADLLEKEGYL